MDHTEVVNILQAIRNVKQLNSTLVDLQQDQVVTYELNAVNILIRRDEVVDVSVLHPFRNESEPAFTHGDPKEW